MGDQDWLDEGHGAGESLQSMIKGSSPVAVDRASIRSVLRGTDSAKPRASRRRNKALVGWLLYCFTAVGGTAAAFTVRDTLFPSLGAPTTPKVWDQGTDTTATTEHGSSSAANSETTVATTVVVTTIAASVESETIPTVASPEGPASSIDNRGPSGAVAPAPGTTVADSSTKGPGPGTTVADNPTDTSTPATTPNSAGAPVTSASTPADPADGGHQNGKGGGSSGGGSSGGGGGGGGDHDAPPTP